jgi:hypothetical protein
VTPGIGFHRPTRTPLDQAPPRLFRLVLESDGRAMHPAPPSARGMPDERAFLIRG